MEALVTALRTRHAELKSQNDRTVRLGVGMENLLKPVEDGMRIEREREAAESASRRMDFGVRAEAGKGDEEVGTVGGQRSK
ncbi:hypothetical protein L873DRAFT_1668667 [Choiromyces venosus 120613-1]|uniref:Uncharacterized protein n=1 Tax=Choiromyces venosus 120613-1 TaxID=1336337 RepID=A0A3N4JZE6_9PEZI|nr:hypothetical protein L873DRAFT_1668667 [Choiromyces venosus 120613-1]